MKSVLYGVVTCWLMAGCSGVASDEADVTSAAQQALEVGALQSLTLKQGTLATVNSEGLRQQDTLDGVNPSYYRSNQADLLTGASIDSALSTLSAFRSKYGFSGREVTATYYNRGDLGIGREMHCVNNFSPLFGSREIACYVRNFAAGDDDSEFTFGMSPDIAFQNIKTSHAFATVGMVFRFQADQTGQSRMIFVVYDKNEDLDKKAATLDRAGILFNNAFSSGASLTGLGIPGENFNNHIPSNCAACHGSSNYNASTHRLENSKFLPFDLDQLEFDSTHTRANQEDAFRELNQMVWFVAGLSTADVDGAIANQLKVWYDTDPITQLLAGNFHSERVPAGWDDSGGPITDLYRRVVRPSCRSCHIALSSRQFNDEASFSAIAQSIADNLVAYRMPQALQTIREFWLSPQPAILENYFRTHGNIPAANTLLTGTPGNVATLDPHLISTINF